MREHIERFFHSCELMGLTLEQDASLIREAIRETVRANPGAKAVKISAYFSSIEIDVVPVDTHVTVAIAAYDPKVDVQDRLPTQPPAKPKALKLWIEKERANRRDDIVSPQAKVSANYASPMMAKAQARADGFDEIILVDEEVLHGVTRSSIIELAKAEGIPLREAELLPIELIEASEAFLTGTTAGVWPVESVDRRALSNCPGAISMKLQGRFKKVARGDDPEFSHWLTPAAD